MIKNENFKKLTTICKQTSYLFRLKRFFSSNKAIVEESTVVDLLNKKLIENKLNNILIYSCKKSTSVLNPAGILFCGLFIGLSYNSYFIFDSLRLKTKVINDEDESFSSSAIRIISTEYFKYTVCGAVAMLGIL
jgi:hypothetical protein